MSSTRFLFASDVDGTLLDVSRSLSQRTTAAVQSVVCAGHEFILCSSRMPASLEILQRTYSSDGQWTIAYNGALVLSADRTPLLDHPLQAPVVREVFHRCVHLKLHASFFTSSKWYAWHDDHWSQREARNTGIQPQKMRAADLFDTEGSQLVEPMYKVMAMGDPDKISELEEWVGPIQHAVSYRTKDTYLEIGPAAASKGRAIDFVADALDIPLRNVVYFGDSHNDVPALELAGTGVAVANATPSALAASDTRTGRGDNDGVAAVLELWNRKQSRHSTTS